jgi:hypothetical protein
MIAVAALAAMSSSAAAALWFIPQSNTVTTSNVSSDLSGYTVYNQSQGAFIRSLNGSSPDACSQSCNADVTCATWVYDQSCTLYQGNKLSSTFYKKNDPGKSYSTYEFGAGTNLDGDLPVCAKACNGDDGCLGFQYSTDPYPGCLMYQRGPQASQIYGFPSR